MGANLNDNKAKLDNIDKAIKAAYERRRKVIVQSKQIAYDTLSELYGLDGQELIDAVTKEHALIKKFTASGMSFEQIGELADNSSASSDTLGQQTLFTEKVNPYED